MIKRRASGARSSSGYQLSIDQEIQLEEHTKRIEVMSRSKSKRVYNSSPVSVPKELGKGDERKHMLSWSPFHQKLDTRTQYRDSCSAPVARFHTTTGSRELQALTSNPQYPEEKEFSKLGPLKRLSLGDISSSLGKIF
jgi:hypothetical protein